MGVFNNPNGGTGLGRRGGTLILALLIAGFSYFKYCSSKTVNEFTGREQHVSITPEQEIAIGLNAAPEMIQQHKGLHPDQRAQDQVKKVGQRLVNNTIASKTPYQYDF